MPIKVGISGGNKNEQENEGYKKEYKEKKK
jgi:hypothetical protein